MSLRNSQYQAIMRMYDRRQAEHRRERDLREQEISEKIPAYAALSDKLSSIFAQRARNAVLGAPDNEDAEGSLVEEILARQSVLLKANGYPDDYTKMRYTCPDCHDTGLIGDEKCHCFKQAMVDLLYRQSFIYDRVRTENFDTFNLNYYSRQTDPSLGISPYDNMRAVLNVCRDFITRFDDEPGNLLFYGDTGVGKTFLTNCIARELLDSSHTVIYLTAHRLVEILQKNTFGSEDEEDTDQEDLYAGILDCDLLIIDDLGSELNNAFVNSSLFLCLDERLVRRRSTIISTNLSLDDLQNNYSERIFSRIVSGYHILKILGDDIRIKLAIGR